jgi:hypothetical protein
VEEAEENPRVAQWGGKKRGTADPSPQKTKARLGMTLSRRMPLARRGQGKLKSKAARRETRATTETPFTKKQAADQNSEFIGRLSVAAAGDGAATGDGAAPGGAAAGTGR